MRLHRCTALALGLLLVVVSTSGAPVVYAPELLRASNAELFRSAPAEHPIGFATAVDAVQAAEPDFQPAEMALKDGVFMATGDSDRTYFVDAGNRAAQRQRQPLRRGGRVSGEPA